jgi:uncharacterized protein (TIGR03086 family)
MPINIPDEIVSLDARAVRASMDLVARATAADMSSPTPCAGWTLRDLLAHMSVQHYGFAAAAQGHADLAYWQPRPLGPDPVTAYRAAAEHVLATFSAGEILDRALILPEITRGPAFPARVAISFHFIDYVVHSWDVAKALGLPLSFDEDLLAVALPVAEAVPGGGARLAPGAAFAPKVTWSGSAPLDRIVAVLGRSPDWKPPVGA